MHSVLIINQDNITKHNSGQSDNILVTGFHFLHFFHIETFLQQVYASALQHAIQNGSLRDRLSIEFQGILKLLKIIMIITIIIIIITLLPMYSKQHSSSSFVWKNRLSQPE